MDEGVDFTWSCKGNINELCFKYRFAVNDLLTEASNGKLAMKA